MAHYLSIAILDGMAQDGMALPRPFAVFLFALPALRSKLTASQCCLRTLSPGARFRSCGTTFHRALPGPKGRLAALRYHLAPLRSVRPHVRCRGYPGADAGRDQPLVRRGREAIALDRRLASASSVLEALQLRLGVIQERTSSGRRRRAIEGNTGAPRRSPGAGFDSGGHTAHELTTVHAREG